MSRISTFAVLLLVVINADAQRGIPGIPGVKGDHGPIGDPGPKGTKGDRGLPGQKGEEGDKGTPGRIGTPGLNGIPGLDGDKGEVGEKGPRGPIGISGKPGAQGPKGDKGLNGTAGEVGIPGETEYSRGESGESGMDGPKGSEGNIGLKGRGGLKGEPGYNGPPGNNSTEKGSKGRKGLRGFIGRKGEPGSSVAVTVRHSQSSIVPLCVGRQTKIREGYSLHSIKVEGKIFHQDLGSSGSCLEKFSTTPTISCDKDNYCHYAMKNETSYWLTASSIPTTFRMPVAGRAIRPFVSRCAVCKGLGNSIAVHSQSLEIPNCPYGWIGLWIGYSFVMHRASGVGSIQLLSSTGSCLEDLTFPPVLECHAGRGSCRISPHQHSSWLASIAESEQFAMPVAEYFHSYELRGKISRCQVCYLDQPS